MPEGEGPVDLVGVRHLNFGGRPVDTHVDVVVILVIEQVHSVDALEVAVFLEFQIVVAGRGVRGGRGLTGWSKSGCCW